MSIPFDPKELDINPDKPSLLNGGFFLPQVFREEMYKQSRICYAK